MRLNEDGKTVRAMDILFPSCLVMDLMRNR